MICVWKTARPLKRSSWKISVVSSDVTHVHYSRYEKGAVVFLLQEQEERKKLLLFADGDSSLNCLFVCHDTSKESFLTNTHQRVKWISHPKALPASIPKTQNTSNWQATAVPETVTPPWKPSVTRGFYKDEMDMVSKQDKTRSLNDKTQCSLKTVGQDFMLNQKKWFSNALLNGEKYQWNTCCLILHEIWWEITCYAIF